MSHTDDYLRKAGGMNRIWGFVLGLLLTIAPAWSATLLPPGKNCFYDSNGASLAAGSATFYIPSTSTLKTTWQDGGQVVANANPVILDSAGCALIYGSGTYREVLKDLNGNLIWDQLTADTSGGSSGASWGGISTGSLNAQIVTAAGFAGVDGQIVNFQAGFTNSGPTTVKTANSTPIVAQKDTPTGSVPLVGGEIVVGNVVSVIYSGGIFHLVNPPLIPLTAVVIPPAAPGGRLSLTNGSPVMTGSVSAATTVYWVPYLNGIVPIYDGSATFVNTASSGISLALDSNPAHGGYQQGGKNFDLFADSDSSTVPATLRLAG